MSSKEEKYGSGVIVPVITPLKKDGRIDHKSLQRIIKHDIGGGVHGIFVLGTTGEGKGTTTQSRRIKKSLCIQ
jgi:4-hydroxy-tetrahydrodipicolinate synthase